MTPQGPPRQPQPPEAPRGGVEVYMAGCTKGFGFAGVRADDPRARREALHGHQCRHQDSPFAMVGTDPNQYLLYTDIEDFDYFSGTLRTSKECCRSTSATSCSASGRTWSTSSTRTTSATTWCGSRATRCRTPPIVYRLHEYMPICHRDGADGPRDERRAVRGGVSAPLPRVLPRTSRRRTFYMRKRFIQSHLCLVDLFIAPSEYVKAALRQWGMPASKIVVERRAIPPDVTADQIERASSATGGRNRFAYFGQLNPYKGADVLLRAMDAARRGVGRPRLALRGEPRKAVAPSGRSGSATCSQSSAPTSRSSATTSTPSWRS